MTIQMQAPTRLDTSIIWSVRALTTSCSSKLSNR